MKIYAVFRHGNTRFSDWHVFKLYQSKTDAEAFVAAKNPKACRYTYKVQAVSVVETKK